MDFLERMVCFYEADDSDCPSWAIRAEVSGPWAVFQHWPKRRSEYSWDLYHIPTGAIVNDRQRLSRQQIERLIERFMELDLGWDNMDVEVYKRTPEYSPARRIVLKAMRLAYERTH